MRAKVPKTLHTILHWRKRIVQCTVMHKYAAVLAKYTFKGSHPLRTLKTLEPLKFKAEITHLSICVGKITNICALLSRNTVDIERNPVHCLLLHLREGKLHFDGSTSGNHYKFSTLPSIWKANNLRRIFSNHFRSHSRKSFHLPKSSLLTISHQIMLVYFS